jgi:hypothetical protein
MRRSARGAAAALLSLLCAAVPASGQDSAEVAFVRGLFAALQPLSTVQNREYCGYIGYDAEGRLTATAPERGRAHSCEMEWPEDIEVIASYHTQGGFDRNAWSEVPSIEDMEGDEADGIDGYVATPGGRLWYIDSSDMVASLICGIGCLPMDEDFRPGVDGDIQDVYSYDELLEKLEE